MKLHKEFIRFAFRHKDSRLMRRQIIAKWNPIDLKSGNPLQVLTDAMMYNATVQINYRNSGWRTILPYGWNSSKNGNILLMCYKDTGEIRSYRIDRIYDLLVSDELLNNTNENESHMSFEDFQMPTLPNLDEIIDETEAEIKEELPYDAGLKALTDGQVESVEPVNTVNDDADSQEQSTVISTTSGNESEENNDNEEDTSEETEAEKEDDDDEDDFTLDDEDLDFNFDLPEEEESEESESESEGENESENGSIEENENEEEEK